MAYVLVTGGTGFIGSHTVVELIKAGKNVLIVDSLINSKKTVLDQIEKITGVRPKFIKADLVDENAVTRIFTDYEIESVIHFAGLKAVGESVKIPLMYYQNNLISTLNILNNMLAHGVDKLVFSSSATVYGDPATVPIREDFPLSATNPYGRTKLMIEQILSDMAKAVPHVRFSVLRYFNPIGAHESGHLGEDPRGIPNNLVPYVARVAAGILPQVNVFGNDYKTHDGTGVRDYIHVVDLAKGHLCALKKLETTGHGVYTYNLGTGTGYSVLDMVKAFSEVLGRQLPYKIVERRPGDIDSCYADPSFAEKEIGFRAQYDLKKMCEDSWHFQQCLGKN